MTTRTFTQVADSISPVGIITISHEGNATVGHTFTIVKYGSNAVNRTISSKELAGLFAAGKQDLRKWIMKKTGCDSTQIMAHLK